jgi:aspartate aminotransferase
LVFGDEAQDLDRVATIQTVSGTGANHLGARFLSFNLQPRTVWISDPSWILHGGVWEAVAPSVERRFYPYYDTKAHSIDFAGMIACLRSEAQFNDVVILHGCAHNPTGLDLSRDQWIQVADLCEKKSLFPFFDIA